jgi:predicted anti-sigma-YlaC factor YlaD
MAQIAQEVARDVATEKLQRAREASAAMARRPSVAPVAAMCLLVTAVAQIVGALPHLFTAQDSLGHLSSESAAFEIALAAGFVAAALRPAAVSGIRIMATVLTVFLVFTTGVDVARSALALPLESHHLIAMFGSALLWLLPTHASADSFLAPRLRLPGGLRSM